MKQTLKVTMPDGSIWAVPVMLIARSRADFYKDEFDNDIEKSLKEDTIPLFEDSDYEITDWAAGNMNWDDVKAHATELPRDPDDEVDYQEGWVNGDKELVDEYLGKPLPEPVPRPETVQVKLWQITTTGTITRDIKRFEIDAVTEDEARAKFERTETAKHYRIQKIEELPF